MCSWLIGSEFACAAVSGCACGRRGIATHSLGVRSRGFPAVGAVFSLYRRATLVASVVTLCVGGVLVSCRCSALVGWWTGCRLWIV